ncbi:splicing regulator SDE2 [Hypanus sabinus]|uniref:splicing regulator SDE2 n=1 Tax=Hypanus sabinus TaxID=79690 RepID=UPI0028C50B92|nr:splicing regulator SDE2 [Hypanus sabinus]
MGIRLALSALRGCACAVTSLPSLCGCACASIGPVMEVWVRGWGTGLVALTLPPGSSSRELKLRLNQQGFPAADIYLKCNGKLVTEDGHLHDGAVYSVEPRLVGGKGGFGSMLRALGAQIEKTTNREACRDLSGRRLRDVNHEKAMAEWIKKQAERETEKEQRRLERLQRRLAEPKHYFTDPQYEQQLDEMSERLEDSVLKGLQASSSDVVAVESGSQKRAHPDVHKVATEGKKRCLWMGVEDLEGSGSSDEECVAECSSSKSLSCPESSVGQVNIESSTVDGVRDCAPGPSIEPCVPAPISKPQNEPGKVDPEPSNEVEAENLVSEGSEQLETEEVTENSPKEMEKLADKGNDVNQPATEPRLEDWRTFNSAEELECLGLDRLKSELMEMGLKCGGTLQERAARLFSVKGLSREQIDPTLFSKPAKGKKK